MNDALKRDRPKLAIIIAGVSAAALILAGGGYWLGAHQRSSPMSTDAQAKGKILYWYDPMVPAQHFDKPGKSPFMDMQLVPRYAGEAPEAAGISIDPGVAQNLGVRLVSVEQGPISRSVTAAGVIAFNERDVAVVQARAGGFVERSHKRAIGDVIARGAPLVDIRVPEWTAAQAEYLALRGGGNSELSSAARQRLVMLGMPQSLIERVEADGAPHPVFTVTAPIAGAITALDARAGMSIMPGSALATISSISPVWLVVSVPQANAGMLKRGDGVSATLSSYPGETFNGRVEGVLPAADLASRTIEIRIALANPNGRLRPGMTAQAQLSGEAPRQALLVPSEAVIRTGKRNIVITALDGGRYAPAEVVLGDSSGANVEVRQGLREGQKVVASGQFLIDSEASLSGAVARLEARAPNSDDAAVYDATGRITALDGQSVTLAHGPVPGLSWPAMTMQFSLADANQARGLKVGDQVSFRFHQGGAGYVVDAISKEGAR
jgi:Cu(I)/Ag(I) efflux system membrane fusion protein